MFTVVILSKDGMEQISIRHPEQVAALMTLNKGDLITLKTNDGYYVMKSIAQKGFEIPTNTYTIMLTS
jgi:hypothetical protein